MAVIARDAIGQYQVVKLLGRGACGEVYQVRSTSTGTSGRGDVFAMKVIPCDTGSDKSAARARESALAEAKILQNLRHPHIVSCSAVFFDEALKVVRIVLEYMDGGDLQGVLAARREAGGHLPSPHFSRRTLAAVGSALLHVHGAGILHRDVKPANILLSRRSRRIKLSDFGIAKLVEATTLRANTLVGTPYYFSPELVSGDEYGVASDCWALGACLYEVASLRRPFEAANQLALIRKICEEAPAPLPEETVEDVRRVIDGLLCKRPIERMSLATALHASAPIAALAISEDDIEWAEDGEWESYLPDSLSASRGEAKPPTVPTELPTIGGEDSWSGAQLVESTPGPAATHGPIQRARHVLSADVDDPEDLQLALLSLEGYRQGPISPEEEAICSSLEEEFRTRIGALRDEAAALLEGLLLNPDLLGATANTGRDVSGPGGTLEGHNNNNEDEHEREEEEEEEGSGANDSGKHQSSNSNSNNNSNNNNNRLATLRLGLPQQETEEVLTSRSLAAAEADTSTHPDVLLDSSLASPRSAAATSDAEDALEVATSLGLDTGAAEEHLASIRKMLSIRVVWGEETRFCLLPMRATFAAVLQQVSRRFGLRDGTILQMCWLEAGDRFSLSSQRDWEELLQRRGLAGGNCRLELEIGNAPLRRRRRLALTPSAATVAPQHLVDPTLEGIAGHDLLRVAGTQAPNVLRGATFMSRGTAAPIPYSVLSATSSTPTPAAAASAAAAARSASPPAASSSSTSATPATAAIAAVAAPTATTSQDAIAAHPSQAPLRTGYSTFNSSPFAACNASGAPGAPGAPSHTTVRRRWQAGNSPGTAADAAAKGKAWAVTTGREQPVRWAPSPALVVAGPGCGEPTQSTAQGNAVRGGAAGSPPLDLCLQGVAARRL